MNQTELHSVVEEVAEKAGLFLVEIKSSANNRFCVYIDGDDHPTLKELTGIHRAIEEVFDREVEDYGLEVSSPGMGTAFKVKRQYHKHIGRDVKVLLLDGKEFTGNLDEVSDEGVQLSWDERVPKEIGKGKVTVRKTELIRFEDIKETKRIYNFK